MNGGVNIRFDSVILAGGFGKRMLPLTEACPKPMLTVSGEPAYSKVLALLRKNGFMNTAVTTMYLPESIERFKGDARHSGGTVTHFRESSDRPLGSAGAVYAVRDMLGDAFCVISGDAVCDFRLHDLYSDFLSGGYDAAMLLHRTHDAGEYGTVCVERGLVTGFCEKPSARDTLSDLINTGIYFLRREAFVTVCGDGNRDFGKDIFPALLKAGGKIKGYVPDGYWFDIGSFYDYHKCNMYLSGGKNVIGTHASIHPEANIQKSVLLDGVTVGNSFICGSIIGAHAVIGNGCVIPPGCVIGGDSELRDGVALSPGSIIPHGSALNGDDGYFSRKKPGLQLDDEHINADPSDRSFFMTFGARFGVAKLAVIAQNAAEEIYALETACGAAGSGTQAFVCTGLSPATAAFTAREFGFDKIVHIASVGERIEIRVYGKDGMLIPREEIRRIAAAEEGCRADGGSVSVLPRPAVIKHYIDYLKKNTGAGENTVLSLAEGKNNAFAAECAAELKTRPGGATYSITPDGTQAFAVTPDGNEVSYWHLLTALCTLLDKKQISLPRDTPAMAESLLNAHAVKTVFYGDNTSPERSLAAEDTIARDGTMLVFTLAKQLQDHGMTLDEAVSGLSPFSVLTRSLYADRERIPSLIAEMRDEYGGGRCVGFDIGEGHVSIFPSAAGAFRIIAEAFDSETAEEISLRAIELIEKKENTLTD